MKYKMTYNNKNMAGCSARGISIKETKEELLRLQEELKDCIYNVKIEKVESNNAFRKD